MAHESVLVIEDEEDIAELIRFNLAKDGYRVAWAATGEEGLTQVERDPPDLVLLDLMLPGVHGLDVCRRLKAGPNTAELPVVIVSAHGEESDVVTGLELGAEDYITKPFSPRVLVARVRAVLRRAGAGPVDEESPIAHEGVQIHPGRREVRVDGGLVELTNSEFRILHLLARRPGWVFTRYQIVDGVRGENYPVTERSVDVQIVGLRKKLGTRGGLIETVRGVGYRFKGD